MITDKGIEDAPEDYLPYDTCNRLFPAKSTRIICHEKQQKNQESTRYLILKGLIAVTVQYLLDAEAVSDGLKLLFFNPQTGDLTEVLDKNYRPYFYVPYPPSKEDEGIIEELAVKATV